ncbi:MAG: ABC transporter transmembrane domain-containing protein, partial [Hyphomicrobiaceae bacterium]
MHLRKHRRTLLFSLLCMVGAAALEILRPWPIKIIFDGILIPTDQPDAVVGYLQSVTGGGNVLLGTLAVSILAIAVIGGLFAFGQAYLLSSVGQKVVASIRHELYSHIQHLSQSFHDTASSGDLLARLTGDVRMMRDLLVTASIYISARCL